MEEVTIPLVGVHNQRDDAFGALSSAKDQRFINCIWNAVKNPVTGETKLYVEKRPGWGSAGTVKAGSRCRYMVHGNNTNSIYFEMSDGNLYNQGGSTLAAFSGIEHSIPVGNAGADYTAFCDGGDIYYIGSANSQFTADTTIGSPVLSNVSGVTVGIYPGLAVTGTGIPANTRIQSVDSATQVTLSNNATATNAGVTISVTNSLALVTDADVENPTSLAFMDGYLFYGSGSQTYNGRIYNSDINSLTSYAASNYISFNEESDEIVSIARNKSTIIAFGDKTISFYINDGNPSGSPLSRVRGTHKVGIGLYESTRTGYSITRLNDSIYFASSAWNGSIGIYEIGAGGIRKVSTPQEDAILSTVSSSGQDIVISGFKLNGCSYISVVSYTGSLATSHNVTLIYNVDLNIWGEWSGNLHTFILQREASNVPILYAASNASTSGKYYQMPDSSLNYTYQDDGASYTMTIQTSKTDFGTDDLKSVWEVALMGSDIQSSGTATLEYSDDDYTTWVTAGTFDLTKINPRITRAGSFRGGRAWRLTHSANTPFRAQALKFKFSREAH
jgi:hypothetical protein